MEILGINLHVERSVKEAYNKASIETGRLKRDIMKEALEDWLVANGFMGNEEEHE